MNTAFTTRDTLWAGMQKVAFIALVMITVGLHSCLLPDNEAEIPNTPGAYDVQIEDTGNQGNGADLLVSFSVPEAAGTALTDFRIMVVPAAEAVGFTIADAGLVEEGRYVQAEINGSNSNTNFSADDRDINGQLIVDEVPYRVYVFTIADGVQFKNNHLSIPSFEFVLDDRPDPALSVSAADAGNENNAGDIRVSFNQPDDRSGIAGYRIMIVPEGEVNDFSFTRADQVPSDRYLRVELQESRSYNLALPADLPDVNGDPITSEQEYRIVVTTLANGDEALSNNLTFAFRAISLINASYVTTLGDAFNGDGSMALSSDGFLYVSEVANDLEIPQGTRIWKINTETGERTLFSDEVFAPSGMVIGGGYLWVSSYFAGEIYRFQLSDPNPQPELWFKDTFRPSYLFWRGNGILMHDPRDKTLYSIFYRGPEPPPADSLLLPSFRDPMDQLTPYLSVRVINGAILANNYESATVLELIPSAGFGDPGSIREVITLSGTVGGVAPYRLGTIVSLRNRHQIVYYNSGGIESTLVGTGIPGKSDGSFAEASFSYPREILQGPEGNVYYVQDRSNPATSPDDVGPVVIRKIVFAD